MSRRQPTSTSVEADSVLRLAPLQPDATHDGITMTDQHGSATVFFGALPPSTARYDVKTSDVMELHFGAGQQPQQGLVPQHSRLQPQPGGGGRDLPGPFSAHCSHTILNHGLPRGPDPGAYNSDDSYQCAHNICGLAHPLSADAAAAADDAHQQMQHMMGAGPLAPTQHGPHPSMFFYQNNGCDREHALNEAAAELGFPPRRTQASNAYQHTPQ